MDLSEVPKHIAVIGGGYIGLEISGYLRKLGAEVTVIEATASLLNGVVDPECAQVVAKKLTKQGVKVLLNAKAKAQVKKGSGFELTVEVAGAEQKIACDKILVTVGRKPNSDQMGLKKIDW